METSRTNNLKRIGKRQPGAFVGIAFFLAGAGAYAQGPNMPGTPSIPLPNVPAPPRPSFPASPGFVGGPNLAGGPPSGTAPANFPVPPQAPSMPAPPTAAPNSPGAMPNAAPPAMQSVSPPDSQAPTATGSSPVQPVEGTGVAPFKPGEYYSGDHHFRFSPPSDWARMTAPDLQFVINASGIPYDTGYRHQGSITPYLLIQVLPAPPGDPASEIPDLQNKGVDASYDSIRHCLITRRQISLPGGPLMKVTSYGFVGKQATICLHCYQLANEPDYGPSFESIANSFQFDPGFDFNSRGFTETYFGRIVAGGGEGARIGGIAGALAGLLLTIARMLQKRKLI